MGGACSSDEASGGGGRADAGAKYDAGANTTAPTTTDGGGGGSGRGAVAVGKVAPHARGHTRGQSIDMVSQKSVGESRGAEDLTPEPNSTLNIPGIPTGPAPSPDHKPRKLDKAQLDKLKASSLKASIFGECLTPQQLQFLAAQCEIKKWSHIGDRICEQGAKADCMYLVHKGEVLLEVTDALLDNRPNQIQVAKVMAEQVLVPLTDEKGNALPKDHITKSPKRSGRAQNPSTLHPSSIAHPSQAHAAARASSHGTSVMGQTRNEANAPLTRAELIAIEAAARIEQEAFVLDSNGKQTDDKEKRRSMKEGSSLGSALANPVPGTPGTPSATTERAANDPELASLVASLPSTYAAEHTMFMCVKERTQVFGVGMFFAQGGRYMYSAVNNALSTHLIILSRKAFDALWKQWPDSRGPLMKHLGECLEDSLARANWLRDEKVVPPIKLTLLTSLFHQASVGAGVMLFEEGDICNDDSPLYFIFEGSVELTFTNEKGHKLTKKLGAGSLFGELGVLLGFSITASAMTLEPCIFRCCKRRWLNLFAMMVPQLVPTLRTMLTKNYHVRDEQLLENLHVQSLFTEFCLKEFNAENIEFWTVAIRFRKVVFPNQCHLMEDVLNEAAMIYNRFISETSVLQINIKQAVRNQIKETLTNGEVTKDLFLAAEREICQLMLQDTFTRFKATPLYTQALSMLHAPAPLPILLNHTNTTPAAPTIRAKEYSRTDDGSHTVQTQGRMRRPLSLDTEAPEGAVAIPLMFGGGKRPTGATPSGHTPVASQASNKSRGLHVSPPKTPGDPAEQNPLLTPQQGPVSAAGHFLSTPAAAQLQLSPGTDKFRLHSSDGGESLSPKHGAPDVLRARASFALDAPPTDAQRNSLSIAPASSVGAPSQTDTDGADSHRSEVDSSLKRAEEEKIGEKTPTTPTGGSSGPHTPAGSTTTKPKPKPRNIHVPADTAKGTPPSIPKQKLKPKPNPTSPTAAQDGV